MNKQNVIDALRNAQEHSDVVRLRLDCSPEKELSLRIISLDDKGNVEGEEIEKRSFRFNISEIVSDIGVCPKGVTI